MDVLEDAPLEDAPPELLLAPAPPEPAALLAPPEPPPLVVLPDPPALETTPPDPPKLLAPPDPPPPVELEAPAATEELRGRELDRPPDAPPLVLEAPAAPGPPSVPSSSVGTSQARVPKAAHARITRQERRVMAEGVSPGRCGCAQFTHPAAG